MTEPEKPTPPVLDDERIPDRVARLTATVDQLQVEHDRLAREMLIALALLAALAFAVAINARALKGMLE